MHRILRQILDISAPTEAAATTAQNALSVAFRGAASEKLSETLDALSGTAVIRLRRLEIDLGELSGPNWIDAFIERMQIEIARHLSPDGDPESDRMTEPMSDRAHDAAGSGIETLSPSAATAEALTHFLQTGRLPWWCNVTPGPGWFARAMSGLSPAAARALTIAAMEHRAASERLIEAIAARRLAECLAITATRETKAALIALDHVLAHRLAAHQRRDTRRAFWRDVHETVGSRNSATESEETSPAIRAWQAAIQLLPAEDAVHLTRAASAKLARRKTVWAKALRRALEQIDPTTGVSVAKTFETDPAVNPREAQDQQATPKGDMATARTKPPAGPTGDGATADRNPRRSDIVSAEDPAISVVDAGVVILHPFLPELLRRAGLWDGVSFCSDAAPHLAARMLAHAALGRCDTDESELQTVLTMISLPDGAPLLPDLPDPDAIAAVDALLASVLEHWSALRTSSPDWLRSQFLRREGLIRISDTGPVLTVETLAQDVLLSRLPWGIGTITLPWMKETLHVRWLD